MIFHIFHFRTRPLAMRNFLENYRFLWGQSLELPSYVKFWFSSRMSLKCLDKSFFPASLFLDGDFFWPRLARGPRCGRHELKSPIHVSVGLIWWNHSHGPPWSNPMTRLRRAISSPMRHWMPVEVPSQWCLSIHVGFASPYRRLVPECHRQCSVPSLGSATGTTPDICYTFSCHTHNHPMRWVFYTLLTGKGRGPKLNHLPEVTHLDRLDRKTRFCPDPEPAPSPTPRLASQLRNALAGAAWDFGSHRLF